jgi:hypothetical protein
MNCQIVFEFNKVFMITFIEKITVTKETIHNIKDGRHFFKNTKDGYNRFYCLVVDGDCYQLTIVINEFEITSIRKENVCDECKYNLQEIYTSWLKKEISSSSEVEFKEFVSDVINLLQTLEGIKKTL